MLKIPRANTDLRIYNFFRIICILSSSPNSTMPNMLKIFENIPYEEWARYEKDFKSEPTSNIKYGEDADKDEKTPEYKERYPVTMFMILINIIMFVIAILENYYKNQIQSYYSNRSSRFINIKITLLTSKLIHYHYHQYRKLLI